MAKKEILNNDALTIRASEGVVNLVGDAVDTVENAVEAVENTVERVVTVTKNNPFLLAGVAVVAAGVGAFVAYKIAEKRLSAQFDAELGEQIAAAKNFHQRLAKEGDFETPESAAAVLIPEEVVDTIRSYQGREVPVAYNKPETIVDPRPAIEVAVESVEVTQNVFVQRDQAAMDPKDWDYNAEIADRELNPDQPYTISFDEFNENAQGYSQTSVSYFAQDQVLVDTDDTIIDNVEYTVGEDNLTRFGHGSGDPNVVYVRNEKTEIDFEITRHSSSYAQQLFGDDSPSLTHSLRHPNRRSWRADE